MSDAHKLPDQVETVLFDAGGVLLDLDYSYLRRLIDARGIEVREATLSRAEARARTEFDRRVGSGARVVDTWRDYFRLILADVHVPVGEQEALIDTLWDAHRRVGLWTVAVPGAADVVRDLKRRGLKLGVVSNAEGQVARDLDNAGFAGLLDAVVDSHVVGVEKPDPAIFGIALRQLEVPAETAVFVGDVPAVDVAGARGAGIAPILLDRHDLYRGIDAPRLRSLKDLPPLLDEI